MFEHHKDAAHQIAGSAEFHTAQVWQCEVHEHFLLAVKQFLDVWISRFEVFGGCLELLPEPIRDNLERVESTIRRAATLGQLQ